MGVIDGLKQQIAEFFAEIVHIIAVDGVGDFVGFLDGVGRDGFEVLFQIPRTAAIRITEFCHRGDKVEECVCAHYEIFVANR